MRPPLTWALDRESVVNRQRDRFGGVKPGSAFFGWLTATGTAVLLTALAAAAGSAVALATGHTVSTTKQTTTAVSTNAKHHRDLAGGITLLVILLLAYFCGGYVAGRMARFDGAKQGVAVWVWAIVIAAVLAIVAAVAGSKYNVLVTAEQLPADPDPRGAPNRQAPSWPPSSSRSPHCWAQSSAAWSACDSTARSTAPASVPEPRPISNACPSQVDLLSADQKAADPPLTQVASPPVAAVSSLPTAILPSSTTRLVVRAAEAAFSVR